MRAARPSTAEPLAGTAAEPATQTDKAYAALRRAILRCEFEPGARLRVEALGQQLDLSSSPVREALSRLAGQGLVHALENRGFRVAPLTVAGVADLVRVRLIVEREALREAIAHGDDAWEAEVVAAGHALALADRRVGDGPVALDDDWSGRHRAFHLALYAGARSPTLQRVVADLFDQAERYRRFSALHRQAPRAKRGEHAALQQAVLARDAERACKLLAGHVSATERYVTAVLLSTGLDNADA